MYHLFPPQQVGPNPSNQLNKSENKLTAIKQEPNILVQNYTVQVPPIRGFTPTRPQSTLQNAFQINYPQQTPLLSGQRKRTNTRRTKKLKEIAQKLGSLQHRVSKLEKKQQKINKAKRNRRRNNQLTKAHHCHISNCVRKYESQTALKQHIKKKHITESMDLQKIQKE